MTTPTGQHFGDSYRRLGEGPVVDMLVLEGHVHEGDRAAATEAARAALHRFVAMGLPNAEIAGAPHYDPVEVCRFIKYAGRELGDDYWQTRQVETLRRFVGDLAEEAPTRASLRYDRVFAGSAVPAGESRRLRMPLPLTARYPDCTITPELPEEAERHRVSDGRLEVKVTGNGGSDIRIGARIDLDLGAAAPDSLDDPELYLREQEGLIAITPEIAALSARLGGEASAENALRAFWEYLIANFTFCPIHYDQVDMAAPLDWVLRTGEYDCQLASSLLIGLARARGIPARLVGGNFLYRHSPTNHYWAEIWLDNEGWFPVDSIGWDLSAGGADTAWRDRFYGAMDARLVSECQPKTFVGAIGAALPEHWVMLRESTEAGAAVSLAALDGQPVYRDEIAFD